MAPCLFRLFGVYGVFVKLAVILTPGLATAATSSSSSQSYLAQHALDDILGRAAPIAGNILDFSLHLELHTEFNTKVSTKAAQSKSTRVIGWPSSLTA